METSRSTSRYDTATVLYLLKKIANWGTQSITTGCFELPVINLISLYTLLKYISDTKKFFRYFTTPFISLLARLSLKQLKFINSRKRSVLISQFLPVYKSHYFTLRVEEGGLSFKNFSGKQKYICSKKNILSRKLG